MIFYQRNAFHFKKIKYKHSKSIYQLELQLLKLYKM